MSAPTIEEPQVRSEGGIDLLIPEVRRQTRRRRLWIGLAIIGVAAAFLLAWVGVDSAGAGAQRSSKGEPAPTALATKADTACSALVSQMNEPEAGTPVSLVASDPSTAGQMATWDEQMPAHLGTSQFSLLPASEPVSVCYVSGNFSQFRHVTHGPTRGTVSPPTHEAVWVLLSHGDPILDFSGPQASTYPPPPGPTS